MSSWKRIVTPLLIACLSSALVSCGGSTSSNGPDTTVPDKADPELVQAITDGIVPILAEKGEVNRTCVSSILSNMPSSEITALSDSASPEMNSLLTNAAKCVIATTTIPVARYTIDNMKIGPGFISTNADLRSKNLVEYDFSDSWLVNANFSRAKVQKGIFSNANLQGADFVKADLRETVWSGANLTCESDWNCTDFTGANLSGADFSNAKLSVSGNSGVILANADLTNANFRNAIYFGVNARGAKFKNTICIDGTNSDDLPKYNGFPQGCL